jgi:sialidase-1
MDLVLRRSTDGGRTWLPLQVLFNDPQGEAKIGNVSAVVDRESGAIHAVFCKDLVHAYVVSSTDDGATWSPAVDSTAAFREFPFAWKFFATGHAHGIQLKSGRLLIPVFMSSVDRFGTEPKEKKTDFRVGVLTSDDHGKSWHAGGLVPDDVLINESTLFEAANGDVVVNSRSVRRSVRVQSRSSDAGKTWSKIEGCAELRGPACQGSSLVTVDPAGKRVVVFTHVTEKNRSNLVAHLSYDDGRTWPLTKVIEPGRAAYGDLAPGDNGTIYLGFEKGGSKTISVARFSVAWLLDGAQQALAAPQAK